MSMSHSSPLPSPTVRPAIDTPTNLTLPATSVSSNYSLRPSVSMDPVDVLISTTAKAKPVRADTKSKQQKASRNGSSSGAIAGIAVATVAAVTVLAVVAKKRNAPVAELQREFSSSYC